MKKALLVILIFLILVVGFILALPWIVPLGEFSGVVEKEINKRITGEAKVRDLRLSTFPWVGVRALDIVVKNDPKFREGEFIRIGEIGLHVKVMPLLQGKMVGEIRVEKPVIRLETLADGRTSVTELMRKVPAKSIPAKEETPAKPIPERAQKMIQTAQIQRFSIVGGDLRLIPYNQAGERVEGTEIRELTVLLERLALQGEIPVQIKANIFDDKGPAVEWKGLVRTDIDLARKPEDAHRVSITSSTLSIGEIVARLVGELEIKTGKPLFVDLAMDAEGISLGRLPKNVPLLAPSVPKDLKGDLNLRVKAKGPVAPFEQLAFDLGAKSTLVSLGLDQKLRMENLDFRAGLHRNVLTIHSVKGKIFGGELDSAGVIHLPPKGGPFLNVRAALKDLDLAALSMAFLDNEERVKGKGKVDLTLQGSPAAPATGPSLVPAWMRMAGSVHVGPGKFATYSLLSDSAKFLVQIAPLSDEAKKIFHRLEWEQIESDLRTENGDLYFDRLLMDYGEIEFLLNGRIARDESLLFNGKMILSKKALGAWSETLQVLANSKGELEIPLRLTGSIAKPAVQLDTKALGKSAVKKIVEKPVREAAQEAKGLLRDLLQPPPSSP